MIATSTKLTGQRAPAWAWTVATFFGAGFGKPGPGTWASIATCLLWAALAYLAAPGSRVTYTVVAALLATIVGIPASTRVSRALGAADPSKVVIDEVAGQLIALIGAPLHWKCVLAGLILFRGFDIIKPFPLRRLERLPEGFGIMLDDVGAGIYALICMQLLLYFGVLV
jgi:phosphatidylglycerophosphatase A